MFFTTPANLFAASQHLLDPGQQAVAHFRKLPIPNPVSRRPPQQRDDINQHIDLISMTSMSLPSGYMAQQKYTADIKSEMTCTLANPTQLNTLPPRVLSPGAKQAQSLTSQSLAKASSQPHMPSVMRVSQTSSEAERSISANSQPAPKQSRSSTTSSATATVATSPNLSVSNIFLRIRSIVL